MPPPADHPPADAALPAFIQRWSTAAARERSNYVLFLTATFLKVRVYDVAAKLARAREADVAEILANLVALGRARPGHTKGTFVR